MKIIDELEFAKKLAEEVNPNKNEVLNILGKCCPKPQDNVLSPDMIMKGIKRLEDAITIASFRSDEVTVKDLSQIIGLLYFVLGFRSKRNSQANAWYTVFGMVDPEDTQVGS